MSITFVLGTMLPIWGVRPPRWRAPKLQHGDELVEATLVSPDGRRRNVVVLRRPHGDGFRLEGFQEPLALGPGDELGIPI